MDPPDRAAGRTRPEEEQENQRDAVAKWLEKDREQTKGP
jgi:hypothetical protein